MTTPDINLTDPDLLRDPFAYYSPIRERTPIARLHAPGIDPMWAVLRHAEAKTLLSDPRLTTGPDSFAMRPEVPEAYRPYLHTMSELNGSDHMRLRRLAAPAFTARRAQAFRPRIRAIIDQRLDALPAHETLDLVAHLARPIPIDVICELIGIPPRYRPKWRAWGESVAAGAADKFGAAIPGIVDGAREAIESQRHGEGDNLLIDLMRAREHDDRLSDTEMVTMVWQLVLAGQTPANLIANALHVLLGRPDLSHALRRAPESMPRAVEELLRWCGPQLLTFPRFTGSAVDIAGTMIPAGAPVVVSIAAVNRDPRAFTDPDAIAWDRAVTPGHLGFAHGPHFCIGAALARVQTEVALSALLQRFPGMRAVGDATRSPDPGTWRLERLPVRLG